MQKKKKNYFWKVQSWSKIVGTIHIIQVVDIHLLKKALALAFRMKSVSSPVGVPNTS